MLVGGDKFEQVEPIGLPLLPYLVFMPTNEPLMTAMYYTISTVSPSTKIRSALEGFTMTVVEISLTKMRPN